MQYRPQNVDRTFGRKPRHALGITAAAVFAVAVIAKRIADERRRPRRTQVAPIAGWRTPAEAIRTAVVTCDGVIVPIPAPAPADPDPTLPLSRAELAAVIDVDGGRPIHDLDYVQRADAMGGAR